MKKEILIIGLGKMGAGLSKNLLGHSWRVLGYNRSYRAAKKLEKFGLIPVHSIEDGLSLLTTPKLVWIMVPSGKAIDSVANILLTLLKKGDVVVDGGNSFYKKSIERSTMFTKRGIQFIDVGVSGGPKGAEKGACLMIGGTVKTFKMLEPLYTLLSVPNGYAHFEGAGAGHFVKMVHNGIEYGMMQAIAEGFSVMKKSSYHLPMKRVAKVYNHGSVVESRLIQWLSDAYKQYGEDLNDITSTVAHSGEGQWTVNTAKELGVPTKIISTSLVFRKNSSKHKSYTGKILSAIRNQFGGHSAVK